MKFSQKLGAHLTPEWRQQYISYVDLKNMILNVTENAPISQAYPSRAVDVYYRNFEEEFFFECEKELRKVNIFYAEKMAEASRRSEALSTTLKVVTGGFRLKKHSQSRYSLHGSDVSKTTKQWKKSKIEELRNAYSELYLSLVLLQNYKVLNHTGFRKILKKHDKLLNNELGAKWFSDNIDAAFFYKNNDLDRLIAETEQNVTQYLENGDRAQAMKRLRVPPLEETQEIGTVFRVGYFTGAFTVLLAVVFLANFTQILPTQDQVYGLLLFRGPFYVIMYLFLLGINVFNWRQFGVNHVLIFEINPRKRLTYTHLLELHGVFAVLWSLCVLGFVYANELHVSRYWFPLLVLILMLAFLLMPFRIFHLSGRLWLLKLMGRVCVAPLYPIGFADFWFGDQLNSLVYCLLDFKYLICFYVLKLYRNNNFLPNQCLENDYIGNTIVRCLPAWFRFAQCLRRYRDTRLVHPFLVNAGKYLSSFPVVAFATLMTAYKDNYSNFFENPFVWCYIVSSIVQTVYCYSWDVLRDFALLQKFSGNNIFLRDQIIYPAKFYYFVIVENFILRFFWAIALFMNVHIGISSYIVDTLAGCLEIFRRYIWNYIRLENEHLFNVGQFRAVRDIFVAPIDDHPSPHKLEKMMDEGNGVHNRRISDKND